MEQLTLLESTEGEISKQKKDYPDIIYFHSDFDGICSAAVLLKFFDKNIELKPVNYAIKKSWLKKDLSNSAVVDFLFNPSARWWFDHHSTTFIDEGIKEKYVKTENRRWDITYKSCPSLILDVLSENHDVTDIRKQFKEWIHWADIIDSAGYSSPGEVIKSSEPCILINQALSQTRKYNIRVFIVNEIVKGKTPAEIANNIIIKSLWSRFRDRQEIALNYIKENMKITKGVGVCDLTKYNIPFIRYGTYYFNIDIKYSIMAYKPEWSNTFLLSLSKNPWLVTDTDFIDLGVIAKKFGGGGKKNIGSISFNDINYCQSTMKEIVNILNSKKK